MVKQKKKTMVVHEQELWKQILLKKDTLVPTEYWPYKTGPVQSSILAQDTETDHSNSKTTIVINLVKSVMAKALKKGDLPIDNKMAIMCTVSPENGEGVGIPVYFVVFNSTYTVCTQIRSDHTKPILIAQ